MNAPDWVYRVADPRVPPAGERPPLLVVLHGIGADENDLFPLASLLDPRLRVVSLRAPRSYGPGRAWFHLEWRPDGTVDPDVAQARETLAELDAWLAAAPARFGTDEERTYLLGFSQGAMMSVGMLRRAPHRLAGVVALSGRSPDGLFEAEASPEAIAAVPLLVAHGLFDDVLPIAHGRRLREIFGVLSRDFTYREFPVAHGIADDELALVRSWLGERLGR